MSKVTLRHVYKVYEGGVRAVNDFDLEIKDKEFIVFVGPSGCGKSTTLRMIAGLENITTGQLYIDDALVNDVDSKDRDIAMVFQNYALYPHMTVFQNMAFGLKLRKEDPKEIERRVNEAADILEIKDLLTRKPKALSGGQRQRVALGRAIVREPKVFLLDEPLSNLDAKLRVQMRTEITKLHKKLETTFIYVTHDQTEAMTMGDRIVVMKLGYVQQVDTPVNLYENPTNLFVATFLGSPQMNIISCKINESNGVLQAKLNNIDTLSVSFPSLKAKQLADRSYLGKDMLLGIRPEHIKISEEGLPATIDVVEQLGDETIIYAKIEGQTNDLVVKGGANGLLKAKQSIHLSFLMEDAHLFDPVSTNSVMGVPRENALPCTITRDRANYGVASFDFSPSYRKRIFDAAIGLEKASLCVAPKDLSLTPIEGGVTFDAVVDFVEKKTDSSTVFAKIKGVDPYLVFSSAPDTPLASGDAVKLYCSEDALTLRDEAGNRLVSREEIIPNQLLANITSKDGVSTLRFGGNVVRFPDLHVADGNHVIRINQTRVRVIYSKKMAKVLKKDNAPYDSHRLIHVSAFDEDVLGSTNAIYVQLGGMDHYATFVVPADFSVYKMPKFDLYLEDGAIAIEQ